MMLKSHNYGTKEPWWHLTFLIGLSYHMPMTILYSTNTSWVSLILVWMPRIRCQSTSIYPNAVTCTLNRIQATSCRDRLKYIKLKRNHAYTHVCKNFHQSLQFYYSEQWLYNPQLFCWWMQLLLLLLVFPHLLFWNTKKYHTRSWAATQNEHRDSSMKFSFAMLTLLHSVAFMTYRCHPELF